MLPTRYDDVIAATNGYEARQQRIARNWDFYCGDQERYIVQRDGETEDEYRSRPKVVSNVVGLALDTKASYLYGVPVSRRLTGAVRDFSARMDAVWRATKMRRFMGQVAIEALVTGNAFICPRWYGFDQAPGWTDAQRLRYVLWPSDFVYPLLDADDRTLVRGYVYRYVYDATTGDREPVGWSVPAALRALGGEKHEYVHLVTDDVWQVWIDGKRQSQLEVPGGVNPYGAIPIVHVVNHEVPHVVEGKSDADDLIGLQMNLNDALSNVGEVVAYHAAPILAGKNIKAKTLTKGTRRFYGYTEPPGQNAGFEYVTYDSAMPSAKLFIDTVLQEFSKVSRVPPTALGNLEELGNLTSGRALMVMYGPLLSDIESKRQLYEEAEQALVQATARVLGYHLHLNPLYYAEPDVQVRWRASIVPQDPLEQAAVWQVQQALGLVSRSEMLRQTYPLLPDSRDKDGAANWDEGPDSLEAVKEEIAADQAASLLTHPPTPATVLTGRAAGMTAQAATPNAAQTTKRAQGTALRVQP